MVPVHAHNPPTSPLPPGGWLPARLLAASQEAGLRPIQAREAVKAWMQAFHGAGDTLEGALNRLPPAQSKVLAPLMAKDQPLEIAELAQSADGTLRILWRTCDAQVIESVVIPSDNGKRTTLCVSSQAGCARQCTFCETGRLGLQRNLRTDEIVAQFKQSRALWEARRGALPPLSNVVFMGMGEPLDNLTAVLEAIALLTHDWCHALAARKISVSTVGVAHKFAAFFAGTQANLALSLNAPDDFRRSQVMPINDRVQMADLKRLLLESLPPKRDVLVEYILFAGFNDAEADAHLLAAWLEGVPARLNLIPANPGPDARLRSPTLESVRGFQRTLLNRGVRTMVRYPHGRDVGGACGQLAGAHRRGEGQRLTPGRDEVPHD